jgi:RNA polymerase sigma factor (sigma-70 family)
VALGSELPTGRRYRVRRDTMQQRNGVQEDEGEFRTPEFQNRIRRRDPVAWAELYEAYAFRLECVARRVLPARLDPEGAAHEAWASALSKARQFGRRAGSGGQGPYPWLCRICINYCISVRRRDKGQPDPPPPRGASAPAGRNTEEVSRAVARLKPAQQLLIYLRFACQMAASEIGQLLGISVDAVRSQLYRAYEKLRAELGYGMGDAGPVL